MSRVRQRITASGGGTAIISKPFYDQSDNASSDTGPWAMDTCTDVAGVKNGEFVADHVYASSGVPYNGTRTISSGGTLSFNNFTPQGYRGLAGSPSHLPDDNRPSNPYLATLVVARTNPSRSIIDLPVSLFELRELPDLVRSLGNNLIRRWAKGTLMREFGWTPLASDYNALLSFSKSTSDRMELLKKLSTAPMLRKVNLYDSTVTGPRTSREVQSTPVAWYHEVTEQTMTSRKVWGYVTWTPDVSGFERIKKYDPDFKSLSRNIVLGTTLDAYTLWNALPWSWLADWYGNIGDYLLSKRNLVPCTPNVPSICETTTSVRHSQVISGRFIEPGDFPVEFRRVTKARSRASADLPSAHMPLLTQRQVNILASLAVLRLR